jgi:hypothetical protein
METRLKEAMTSGVLIEVRDAGDNSLGQSVHVDWRGRPVPAVGDTLACDAVCPASGRAQRVVGRVRARHFDVQREEGGGTCVWVRVVLDALPRAAQTPASTSAPRTYRPRFSAN